MSDVIVIGTGGFARELAAWIKDCWPAGQNTVKGFLSTERSLAVGAHDGQVIGDRSYLAEKDDVFVVGLSDPDGRREAAAPFLEQGARFLTVVHPTAILSPTAQLGVGVAICPYATVSEDAVVGSHSLVNLYASVGYEGIVGNHCILAPYATLSAGAVLEDEVFLATRATVAPSRRVGATSRVAANSAVNKDVPPRSLVVGVPGRTHVIY